MKKYRFFILLIVFLPLISFSQDNGWTRLGTNINGEYFLNKNRITSNGAYLRVWIKHYAKGESKSKTIAIGLKYDQSEDKNKWFNFEYSITLKEFDCQNNQAQTLEIYNYDKSGNCLSSHTSDLDGWSTIPPETLGERILKEVCSSH